MGNIRDYKKEKRMWYLYLRRDQHYLRSYRTHNLWLNMYHKKMRIPKINAWHVAVMRRMSKSVSTMRVVGAIYSITLMGAIKGALGFSEAPASKEVADEENYRLMSDFELLLESVLNEQFLDSSVLYYDDELTATEIVDQEGGLAGDFAPADVQSLLHDKSSHDHESFKAVRHPDRVGTNYPKGDALSCYKILPKQ